MRKHQKGFTLLELVMVIIVVGALAVYAIPLFISQSKDAERAVVESETGNISSALHIYSIKQLARSLTITAHNPFDDMTISNYAGSFGDVDGTNCPAGYWAYQSGNAANGNWAVIVYRAKSTLTQAFSWGGMQWIIYTVNVVTDTSGRAVDMKLTEYPPLHRW
jgi:prepilin-type N-terminal cleavage/methylation domain-containing protein